MSWLFFLLGWSLKIAVVVLFGSLALLFTRKSSASTRHLVWRFTLGASILLPLVIATGPRFAAPVLPPEPVKAQVPTYLGDDPLVATITHPLNYRVEVGANEHPLLFKPTKQISAPPSPSPSPLSIAAVSAAFVYGFVVLCLGLRWCFGFYRVRQMSRQGTRAMSIPGMSEVNIVFGLDPALHVPVTYGFRNPVILLPPGAELWSEQKLSAVLFHEQAHIRRNDWLWQTIATVVCSVHWFNPLSWALAQSLGRTAEASADDEVLRLGVAPSAYASELLKIAEGAIGPRMGCVAMAKKGGVSERLKYILTPNLDRSRPRREVSLWFALTFAAATAAISGFTFARQNTAREFAPRHYSSTPIVPELKFVSQGPFGRDAWDSKGNELPSRAVPYYLVPADPNQLHIGFQLGNDPINNTIVKFKPGPLQMVDQTTTLRFSGSSTPATGQIVVASFQRPPKESTVDLTMGVASGRFAPVASARPGHDPLVTIMSVGPGNHFSTPTQPPGDPDQWTAKLVVPPANENDDLMVTMFDRDGKVYPPGMDGIPYPDGLDYGGHLPDRTIIWAIPKGSPVTRVEMQARKIVWYKFRNVSLRLINPEPHHDPMSVFVPQRTPPVFAGRPKAPLTEEEKLRRKLSREHYLKVLNELRNRNRKTGVQTTIYAPGPMVKPVPVQKLDVRSQALRPPETLEQPQALQEPVRKFESGKSESPESQNSSDDVEHQDPSDRDGPPDENSPDSPQVRQEPVLPDGGAKILIDGLVNMVGSQMSSLLVVHTEQRWTEESAKDDRLLDLTGAVIRKMPRNLAVGGNLCLKGAQIDTMSETVAVGGSVDMSGSVVNHFPTSFRVGGSLDMRGAVFSVLPENLAVGGSLDLTGTLIHKLPESLQVSGAILLSASNFRMEDIPERFKDHVRLQPDSNGKFDFEPVPKRKLSFPFSKTKEDVGPGTVAMTHKVFGPVPNRRFGPKAIPIPSVHSVLAIHKIFTSSPRFTLMGRKSRIVRSRT